MPLSRSEVDFCRLSPLILMSSEHLHRVKLVDVIGAGMVEGSGSKGLTQGSGSLYNSVRTCTR